MSVILRTIGRQGTGLGRGRAVRAGDAGGRVAFGGPVGTRGVPLVGRGHLPGADRDGGRAAGHRARRLHRGGRAGRAARLPGLARRRVRARPAPAPLRPYFLWFSRMVRARLCRYGCRQSASRNRGVTRSGAAAPVSVPASEPPCTSTMPVPTPPPPPNGTRAQRAVPPQSAGPPRC